MWFHILATMTTSAISNAWPTLLSLSLLLAPQSGQQPGEIYIRKMDHTPYDVIALDNETCTLNTNGTADFLSCGSHLDSARNHTYLSDDSHTKHYFVDRSYQHMSLKKENLVLLSQLTNTTYYSYNSYDAAMPYSYKYSIPFFSTKGYDFGLPTEYGGTMNFGGLYKNGDQANFVLYGFYNYTNLGTHSLNESNAYMCDLYYPWADDYNPSVESFYDHYESYNVQFHHFYTYNNPTYSNIYTNNAYLDNAIYIKKCVMQSTERLNVTCMGTAVNFVSGKAAPALFTYNDYYKTPSIDDDVHEPNETYFYSDSNYITYFDDNYPLSIQIEMQDIASTANGTLFELSRWKEAPNEQRIVLSNSMIDPTRELALPSEFFFSKIGFSNENLIFIGSRQASESPAFGIVDVANCDMSRSGNLCTVYAWYFPDSSGNTTKLSIRSDGSVGMIIENEKLEITWYPSIEKLVACADDTYNLVIVSLTARVAGVTSNRVSYLLPTSHSHTLLSLENTYNYDSYTTSDLDLVCREFSENPTTFTDSPSQLPTHSPTHNPTNTTITPTQNPTDTPLPSTQDPTGTPFDIPTESPNIPTSQNPTLTPTHAPTNAPIVPTQKETFIEEAEVPLVWTTIATFTICWLGGCICYFKRARRLEAERILKKQQKEITSEKEYEEESEYEEDESSEVEDSNYIFDN